MADHFPDYTKKADCISREAAIALTDQHCFETSYDAVWMEEELRKLPSADVVARDCYDRILAENDTMREQLAQIGKKPLDRMDDVRPVVRGKWKPHPTNRCRDVCSNCGVSTLRRKYGINPDGTEWEEEESYQFCPWCAAYMREPNLDTTKGENHD